MRLNHIQTGTPINIFAGNKRDKKFRARFIDNANDSAYYVYCQEMMGNLDSYIGQRITIEINISERLYSAESRITGKGGNRNSYDTIAIELMSGFKEQFRRAHDRYDFQVMTNIFHYSDSAKNDFKGNFICDSISADISKGGMRLLANRKLEQGDNILYTLEFSVKPGSLFSIYAIPAKLVRISRSVSIFSAAFDYGFCFDFSSRPNVQEKLLNDLFEIRLTSALR